MSYYSLKITGKDVRRFVRNLYKMKINFYNIKYIDNSVIIKVSKKDFLKIKTIKTIYEIEILKYYGLAKIKNFIRMYKIFLIILIIGFIFFLGLTNIIFEVDVNHNNKELRELVLEELKNNGISKYKFVVSFNRKEKIKENILNKYKDKIEWLEIKRVGTKYEVELEERKNIDKIDNNTPRNVIAKKNGLIVKIESDHGEIVGKVNQYVKKGDVLISGLIHKKDEVKDMIHANGRVIAETWYTVKVELPYHYYEENKTNSRQSIIRFNWFNKEYNLLDFKKYNEKTEKDILNIKNGLLPISLSIVKQEEIEKIDQVYTLDNAINKASIVGKEKLKEKLGDNIEIIFEKKLKIEEINSKIIVEMFYKLHEDITDFEDITLIQENNVGN